VVVVRIDELHAVALALAMQPASHQGHGNPCGSRNPAGSGMVADFQIEYFNRVVSEPQQ